MAKRKQYVWILEHYAKEHGWLPSGLVFRAKRAAKARMKKEARLHPDTKYRAMQYEDA